MEDKGQGGVRGGKKKRMHDDGNDDTELSTGVRKRIRGNTNKNKKK